LASKVYFITQKNERLRPISDFKPYVNDSKFQIIKEGDLIDTLNCLKQEKIAVCGSFYIME